jgi:6-phosphogluconolactonase
MHQENQALYKLLIGTYTSTKQDGIYVYQFNTNTGALNLISHTNLVENPSYLCVSDDKVFVYAVNESGLDKSDSVSAFQLNAEQTELKFLNKVSTLGTHPCFVSIDAQAKAIFVANYTSGNLTVLPIEKNGQLSEHSQNLIHQGNSVNKDRQNSPHIHATILSPNQDFLLATDLGTDEIVSYKIEQENNQIVLKKYTSIKVKAGSGPRHLVFNTEGTFAYLTLEMSGEVSVFKYHEGQLESLQTLSLEAADFKGENSAADIHLSKDGKFLYASNRGTANSIAMFSVNQNDGTLNYIDRVASGGRTPRNFVIDPTDSFLLVGHQDSHDIMVFERNKISGKLHATGIKIEMESPVCLKFIV